MTTTTIQDLPVWSVTIVYFSESHDEWRPLTLASYQPDPKDAVADVHRQFGDNVAGGYQVKAYGSKRVSRVYDVDDDGKVVHWI